MDDDDDVGGVPHHHVGDPNTGNLDDNDDVGDLDPLDDDDDDVGDPDPLDDDDDDVEDEDEGEGEVIYDDDDVGGVPHHHVGDPDTGNLDDDDDVGGVPHHHVGDPDTGNLDDDDDVGDHDPLDDNDDDVGDPDPLDDDDDDVEDEDEVMDDDDDVGGVPLHHVGDPDTRNLDDDDDVGDPDPLDDDDDDVQDEDEVMDDDDDVGGVPHRHVGDPDTGNLDDDDDVGDPDPLDDDDEDVKDEDEGEGDGNVDDSEGVFPLKITPIFDTEPTESTYSNDEIDKNPPKRQNPNPVGLAMTHISSEHQLLASLSENLMGRVLALFDFSVQVQIPVFGKDYEHVSNVDVRMSEIAGDHDDKTMDEILLLCMFLMLLIVNSIDIFEFTSEPQADTAYFSFHNLLQQSENLVGRVLGLFDFSVQVQIPGYGAYTDTENLDDDDDDVGDHDPLDDDDDDVEDEDEGEDEGEGNVDDTEGVPPLEIIPKFDTEPTESTNSDDEIDENPPERQNLNPVGLAMIMINFPHQFGAPIACISHWEHVPSFMCGLQ
ncbi:acidic leucine-rich nuclear phosphoprotein 32-related protein 1-like [Magnolia sinica]|uniref:acidic leucine-rich nuclear phosphoprotein 32-related protein 1-like n=1 Tax=Magnolia sinica TaxID=86752 RepID=UPI002657F658|nr:acidic leucine-rich nuclear phosphoprotein 32-related protein 1-like [Magnolia sinica]